MYLYFCMLTEIIEGTLYLIRFTKPLQIAGLKAQARVSYILSVRVAHVGNKYLCLKTSVPISIKKLSCASLHSTHYTIDLYSLSHVID